MGYVDLVFFFFLSCEGHLFADQTMTPEQPRMTKKETINDQIERQISMNNPDDDVMDMMRSANKPKK